jgi:hypothetical protein
MGTITVGHAQGEELERECTISSALLEAFRIEILLGAGNDRFTEGEFLALTRDLVQEFDDFTRRSQESWLPKLVGRGPENVDGWPAVSLAAKSFLEQVQTASITGDYSGARNFGAEFLAVVPKAREVKCSP